MDIDGQVCFHRQPFATPVRPLRCTTGSLGPVNGINKDVSSTRLLPTTVSTYPVNWICFCHLLKTQYCCLCPITHLQLPTCPTLFPPTHPPLQRAISDITVAEKKLLSSCSCHVFYHTVIYYWLLYTHYLCIIDKRIIIRAIKGFHKPSRN